MTLDQYQKYYMQNNYRSCTHKQLAEQLNKSPKAVAEWLRKRGLKKCPNYTETEVYLLANFSVKHCSQFIKNKSINALRIKQCRIRKAMLVSESTK